MGFWIFIKQAKKRKKQKTRLETKIKIKASIKDKEILQLIQDRVETSPSLDGCKVLALLPRQRRQKSYLDGNKTTRVYQLVGTPSPE
jgi:hypothetical protein